MTENERLPRMIPTLASCGIADSVENEIVQHRGNQNGIVFFGVGRAMSFDGQPQTSRFGFMAPDRFVFFDDVGDFGDFFGACRILAYQIQENADQFFHPFGGASGALDDFFLMCIEVGGLFQQFDGCAHDGQWRA